MKIKEQIISESLINGVFNGVEAKEVILSIIDYKIKFHHKKILHHFDQTGEALYASDKRISELKEIRKNLIEYLKENENRSFKISSTLDISSQ